MASFSGDYEASITDSVRIRRSQISDFQDQKSQYDVSNYLGDPQFIEFAPEDGLIMSSDYCASITTQPTNIPWSVLSSHAPDNALLNWDESTMESLGLREIIDPIMMNKKQIAAPLYGSSVSEKAVYPETKSAVNEKIQDRNVNHPQENCEVMLRYSDKPLSSRGEGKGYTPPRKMRKRKTDQYENGSVDMETYVQVSAQKGSVKKSKKDICESAQSSSASKNLEEKWNPKFDAISSDSPELLPIIVKEEPNEKSPKDYVHLRARRGQATDSHSLAERVRREKISERMKFLQDLVPGCNKVTGKALVLEKIIDYVQSLQNQVEILSMKLASVLPQCHFGLQMNGHGHPSKEWSNVSQIEDIHGSLMCYKQHKSS